MNIAVVDDEKEVTRQIKKLLDCFAQNKKIQLNISLFQSGKTFLSVFKANVFQIIFMDIYMNELSGIETAQAVRKSDSNCLIIFLTTSLEHMPDAFSCHAFEYVIKPIEKKRIFSVMKDALEIIPVIDQYIEFTSKRKKCKLMLTEFVSAAASGHYLYIVDVNHNQYTVRMTLSELLKLLQNDIRFLTINQGILVNMDFIDSIIDSHCILTNGQEFPIKVRERALIEQKWHDYNFNQIRLKQLKNNHI